jgi:hypothetical protein
MKKSILSIAILLICFGIRVFAGTNDACYVKAGDKVYFGKDIKIGIKHTKIIADDGTVQKVDNRDIKAYMRDGKLFEMLPVVCDKNDTICHALMEYITSRSGLKLYRYCCYSGCESKYCYFVFKDGKFFLRVNDPYIAQAVLPFFGIKVIGS